MLDHHVLSPLGAVVTGLRVDALSANHTEQMRMLLAEHGVVVLPDQDGDDDGFVRFLRSFGPLTFTAGEDPVRGFPDLNVITNVGRATPPRSSFHTDTSYVRIPPAYTALRAVQVPECGGQTSFANQYLAYETLPQAVRDAVAGLSITHVVTGLDLDDDQETSARHPIVLRHPVSGRPALYLSTPQRCTAIGGMSAQVAANTIEYLFGHCTRPEHVLTHDWSVGDVVMWDNRCVLHRAEHDGVVGARVLHRGMVAGVAP